MTAGPAGFWTPDPVPPGGVPSARGTPTGPGEAVVLLVLVGAALALRLLSFVYSVYNYDESLYILMGAELARGHLPYTTVCDLKPFGLFALFGLFAWLPLDEVVAARLAASLTVGFTAYGLARAAALLFDDSDRSIGLAAGLAYVLFTLANGGVAAQGEIFQGALAVAVLLVTLGEARRERPRVSRFAAAGLMLGAGIQVKQSIVFDGAAILAGFLILSAGRGAGLPALLRASLPAFAAFGVAAALPTLAVMALYAGTGQWEAWVAGNVTAHRVFYGLERPFELDPALRAAWEQAPLWLCGLLALLLLGRLANGPRERRAGLVLGLWVVAVCACMVFLRIASDHYFLQFVAPLSLLTGLLVGRGLLAAVADPRPRSGLLAGLVGLSLYAVAKEPLIHTAYILRDRVAKGERHAGDTPRQVAADLKPLMRPGDAMYVVGFQPLIYQLAGARPATRFAFTGLPHRDYPGRDGCPWVEPKAELARVLDSKPRFVVVEDGIFLHDLPPDERALLDGRLGRDYRLVRRYEQHVMHRLYPFERFVMNGGAPVALYERADPVRTSEAPPP